MKPALTPEDWARLRIEVIDGNVVQATIPYIAYCPPEMVMQKIGAACLHNQPFGFTREDLNILQWFAKLATNIAGASNGKIPQDELDTVVLGAFSLKNRIESLLPPVE